SAARAATQQATARYESGLGAITEVAEAQRLLTQAEIDDALARLAVWRGLLRVGAAGVWGGRGARRDLPAPRARGRAGGPAPQGGGWPRRRRGGQAPPPPRRVP